MAKEIERKFLIDRDILILPKAGTTIKQGYIKTANHTVVRVRILGERALLTIKGKNQGLVRSEFEYDIPIVDAEHMLEELCDKPFIDKVRYNITYEKHLWEVDVFSGENKGLCVAEIELASEGESFALPPWVTKEVTGDLRYYNVNLMAHPFSSW